MEVPSFADLQLNLNQPLQQQLHQQLCHWMSRGRLAPGTRLPSSRRMAHELAVSRNTVTAVLEQLKAEGFVCSRPGSGFYVNDELPRLQSELPSLNWQSSVVLPNLSNYGQQLQQMDFAEHSEPLPFTPGIPDCGAFPHKVWLQIQRRHQDRQALMGYHGNQGYLPLRQALADYLQLSRGVVCRAEQVIITQGAQQAISLCAQVLLNQGDQVLVENPGYLGARKAFQACRAQMTAVPVDQRGLQVAALPEQTQARLMYVTPTHQYPLGGILSAAARLKLLDWAAQRGIWLIEDDYDSEFHFYGKPIAALQGMAEQTPVLYMGSFSKTLYPALRLGYLVVPEGLVSTFVLAKSFMGGESPMLTQAVVADFLEEGHFVRHVRRMRQLYQQKWEHLAQLVATELSGLARPLAESAGMHLALEIEGIDDRRLKQDFLAAGFGGSALSGYFLNPCIEHLESVVRTGLVLGFANTTAQQRVEGIRCLRQLIRQQLINA